MNKVALHDSGVLSSSVSSYLLGLSLCKLLWAVKNVESKLKFFHFSHKIENKIERIVRIKNIWEI